MSKKTEKKNWNLKKKWGAEISGKSKIWKMGLIRHFFIYEAILANDSLKCSSGLVWPYYEKKLDFRLKSASLHVG